MSAIVIGDDRQNVSLTLTTRHSSDRPTWRTMGSFRTEHLSGSFDTDELTVGAFAGELERLNRELSGSATLQTRDGDAFVAALEFQPTLGGITVSVDVASMGYEVKFAFRIDQSYLPDLIRSVKTAMQEAS